MQPTNSTVPVDAMEGNEESVQYIMHLTEDDLLEAREVAATFTLDHTREVSQQKSAKSTRNE